MKFQLKKGETSVILPVFVKDSSSTVGAGLSGLDDTSSIAGGYCKRNGTGQALAVDQAASTPGTYEAPSTAGQVRIAAIANMPAGWYELHFHNTLFTTADWVSIGLAGATNMVPLNLEIQLTGVDLNNAANGGLANLDAVISTRASQASVDTIDGLVDEIHDNRLTTARATALDNLDAAITTRASQASVDTVDGLVDEIHDNRLTVARAAALDNLDAAISTRASQASVDTVDGLVDEIHDNRLTAGRAAALDNLDTTVSSRASQASVDPIASSTAAIGAIVTDILEDTGATLPSQIGGLPVPPSAASVADAVWEEPIADHAGTEGSTGEALNASGGGLTASAIADAVWQETVADHSGTAGSTAEALASGAAVTYLQVPSDGKRIMLYQHEAKAVDIPVTHDGTANGQPIDLAGKTLRFVAHDGNGNGAFDIENDSISVVGVANHVARVAVSATDTALAANLHWRLWDATAEVVLAHGTLRIAVSVKDIP